MLVVTLGFLLGRLGWRGMSLGPAGGTMGIAILLGALGLSFDQLYSSSEPRITVGAFGFALFIYSVGFEAGPRFFDSLRMGKGWQFPALGALVNVLAVLLAVACGRLLGLGASVTAGLLAGALTSAPTYAAAVEVVDDRAALAVGFAITFPAGLLGMVLMAQFVPRLMGDDLAAGTATQEEEDEVATARLRPELQRAFQVTYDAVVDRPLLELDLTARTGCIITRLYHGGRVSVPDRDTRLARGDRVMVRGRFDQLAAFEKLVGPEVYDDELRRSMPSPRAIQVIRGSVVGKPLKELELFRQHHSLVTSVQRQEQDIEPSADLCLERGDVVMVAGQRDDVRAVARLLGRFERSSYETDIAIYAGGILLGLLLGQLRLGWLGLDLRLGYAGGLLFAGVLLGRFRRIGPFSAHVPIAARQLVRDLGILIFIAETGVAAGGGSLAGIHGLVWEAVACGLLVTVVPVLGAVLVGRYLLSMRPVDTWGSVCGGMTSSSALAAIRGAA
ncbi:MAG: hypothetical protein GY719_38910, partial [bacterium]|nr:hypothetical protein [bacterium]